LHPAPLWGSWEQRNKLGMTLFECIRAEDGTIKGVTPQIESRLCSF
jgi:hypothetical protein